MTGTYCNFCFVTNDLQLGLFLVEAGQEMTGDAWEGSEVDKEKERQGAERKKGESESKSEGWEVCCYQGRSVR